jgi:sugar phosphate isomerase/epimerase
MPDAERGHQMLEPTHTISVITDEVSPRLEEGIAFALEEGLPVVDVRSAGGVNFLSLDQAAQKAAARQIRDAGLKVGCFATPLLKWSPPGKTARTKGDQFGFDAQGRSNQELYRDAFEAAAIFGTRNVRVFTFLTYDGFEPRDLEQELSQLLRLAERYDAVVHVENEPVCNIDSVSSLVELVRAWAHPRLRALLDIGNAWGAGKPPTEADLLAVMPYVSLMHFKDYSVKARRTVPMGEGDVPYAALLRTCLKATNDRALTLTVETHVPSDPVRATRASLAGLRACLATALASDGEG